MYEQLPSFVLGFHGCDATVADAVFAGQTVLRPSQNEYDWLGHGIYFWEHSPQRAHDYAVALNSNPRRNKNAVVQRPAVVGAVIALGNCMNLLDARYLALVRHGFDRLKFLSSAAGLPLPRNKAVDDSGDLLLRPLDCAVIEAIHNTREDQHLPAFDSVRGMFTEGEPLYEGAGFHARNHIQICVRNPRCIKGYFRVMAESA